MTAPQPTPTPAGFSAATPAGPFTIREWGIAGGAVLLLIASLLPNGGYGYFTIWSAGIFTGFTLAILPLLAGGLVVLRRLVPTVPWRVGSLTVDQWASVITVIVSVFYLSLLTTGYSGLGTVLGFIFSVALLFFTTFAHFLPIFTTEFAERPAGALSYYAYPTVLPLRKVERPVYQQQYPGYPQQGYAPQPGAPVNPYAPAPAAPAAPVAQPFWVLVPEERPVVDEAGATVFTISPAAWAAAIEDRGSELVIRAEDGRTGVLKDVTGISRG